jgi:hypothetical protein
MNDRQYYRAYLNLQKKHEKTSYKIALNGLQKIFKKASAEYLSSPNTPIELLVKEGEHLDFISKIYDNIGIEFAKLVDAHLFKNFKSVKPQYQTKSDQYPLTPDATNKINLWKTEFVRFTQSAECAKKVVGVTKTTKQQIRAVMEKAVAEKLSHKQTAKLILAEVDSITTKQRALTIARTENAVGSNKGAYFSAKSSGLVLYKKWIARAVDSKTRDAHIGMLDTQPIPIDALFTVGGESMAYPCDGSKGASASNICNCRCIVAFVPAKDVVDVNVNKPIKPKVVKPKPVKERLDFSKPLLIDFEDLSTFRPAKTIDEAVEFAKNNISRHVNYTWVKDVDVANRINELAHTLGKEYNLNQLRELGNTVRGKGAQMSANFQTLNISNRTFASNSSIAKHVKNRDDLKAVYIENMQLLKAKYELTKDWMLYERLRKYEQKAKFVNGWTIQYKNEKYLEEVLTHEYGHIIHDQLMGGINGLRYVDDRRRAIDNYISKAQELQKLHISNFQKARANGDIYKISEYGSTNQAEFFAESFVMYRNNDASLPIYIKEFFEKVKELSKL